jgi:RPA family protein
MGAEYFSFLMLHYFDPEKVEQLDNTMIVNKLKMIENDSLKILESFNESDKIKYKFYPLETYMMTCSFIKKIKGKDRFTQEYKDKYNTQVISEDEISMMI